MKAIHYLLLLLLFVIGFFAGTAWKSESSRQGGAQTQDPQPKEVAPVKIISSNEQATIQLFEEAAPSVAFITSINLQRDYWTRNVMEVPRGTGSGFVWDKAGNVVTNYHVIKDGERTQVTLSDQSTWEAEIVGVAPEKDLAILRIKAPPEKLFPMAIGTSNDLSVGQFVFAIGNPFGLDQTLTTGVISALGREIESLAGVPIRDVVQTDAAINPGNSGGPLLDSSGRLIGVNTQIYSPSGASAGIGFAIPVDVIRWVVPDLISFGEIRRPVLGVELVANNTVQRMGLEGALVMHVAENGGADKAGIRPTRRNRRGEIELGDLIVGVGSEKINSSSDLILALEKYEPGDEVNVRLIRDDRPVEVTIQLGSSF